MKKLKQFIATLKDMTWEKFLYGDYKYSAKNDIESFNALKYKDKMNPDNKHICYVTDDLGLIICVLFSTSPEEAEREAKKYIVQMRFHLLPIIKFFNKLKSFKWKS